MVVSEMRRPRQHKEREGVESGDEVEPKEKRRRWCGDGSESGSSGMYDSQIEMDPRSGDVEEPPEPSDELLTNSSIDDSDDDDDVV